MTTASIHHDREVGAEVLDDNAPPDWEKQTTELLCPLCGYNLRGLAEPRCPECGYRFNWRLLQDERKNRHQYLFEHHPERNVRSFMRTLAASQLPRRFWRTLRPEHQPRRWRLFLYCLVLAIVIAASLLVPTAWAIWTDYRAAQQQVAGWLTYATRYPTDPWIVRTLGGRSPQSYAATLPGASFGQFWRQYSIQWKSVEAIPPAALCLAWPWATVLVLMLLRESMRQAKIYPVHVVRCAIYSADATVTLLPLLLLLSNATIWTDWMERPWFRHSVFSMLPPSAAAIVLVAMPMLTYRLAIAYRRYLKFPHAIASVVATQIILLLIILIVFLGTWNI
jgi:hypothetical protein